MERATKLFLVGWACAAIALEAWLLRGGWPGLPMLTLGAFAAGALLAIWDRRTVAFVLVFAYVFPALISIAHGRYHSNYGILWASALVGAVTPDGLRTTWHIPPPWRGALVCWALVVAVSAPIVMGREFDFNPVLLLEERMPTSALGSVPPFVVVWLAQVALTLVLGVLWFDWLFGARLDVHAWIVTPLATSALAMAAVAIYQLFVDVSFLNQTVYGNIGRASGTMFDANVCGTIAALWIGGTMLWAQRLGRWRIPMLTGGVAATWLAVWASGSRTAFAEALLVTAFSLVTLYAARGEVHRKAAVRRVLLTAGVVMTLLVLLTIADLSVVGPVKRVRETLPELSAGSVRAFAVEMWNRNSYGSAASAMIREYPFFGVGVGSFHLLVSRFASPSPDGRSLPPDNAQNWYRHQLAEVGLVGSVGWIVWVVLFARFVLKRHASSPPAAWTVRGMLLALAMISLVGMPGQEISVTITFWTLAFWYVSLIGVPARPPAAAWRGWAVIAAIVAVHAAGTAHLAANQLRVPSRAQQVGWPYSYGFYWPEPDGEGGEYRWARRRAVAVVNAPPGRWMALTVWVNHFDIGTRPVDTKAWFEGRLVIDTRLDSPTPVTKYLRVPDDKEWVLVETRVSRVIRPSEVGVADNRELGLLVKWSVLAGPPPRP